MNWSYVAGVFDGEGSLSMQRKVALVSISQSGEEGRVLTGAIRLFLRSQGVRSYVYPVKTTGFGKKQKYELHIHKRESIRRFIHGVYPHLYVKKVKALDMLRWLTVYPSFNAHAANYMGCSTSKMLQLKKDGLTNKDIAQTYGMSAESVRLRLLNVRKRKWVRLWQRSAEAA